MHPSHETDRKETLAKPVAAAFGTNPSPESLELADDAPAAELPARMNG